MIREGVPADAVQLRRVSSWTRCTERGGSGCYGTAASACAERGHGAVNSIRRLLRRSLFSLWMSPFLVDVGQDR